MNTSARTPKEIFNEALNLIRDPARWTQWVCARDADGDVCDFYSERAVCWCSLGALRKVCEPEPASWFDNVSKVEKALNRGIGYIGRGTLIRFNDTHTHAEVIALWEKVGREQGWIGS